jgi:hypothetical protein
LTRCGFFAREMVGKARVLEYVPSYNMLFWINDFTGLESFWGAG